MGTYIISDCVERQLRDEKKHIATKDVVCENILHGYLYGGDLLFVIVKGNYGFKFPKRFLEISSRDLTSFLLQLI